MVDINVTVYEEFGLHKNNYEQVMHFFMTELGLKGIRFNEGIRIEDIVKLTHK